MFPKPLKLPRSVNEARKDRIKALKTSIQLGILSRAVIVAMEMGGYYFYGSASLFMDGLSTAIDIGSSIILLFFVQLAIKPPDQDHPFGHGRYEPLAGMQLGVLLFVSGIVMIVKQSVDLTESESSVKAPYLFLIPVFAIVLLEASYRYLRYQSKKQDSPALYAESTHFRMDALTSLVAAIALFIGGRAEASWALFDRIGALCIGLIMVLVGFSAIRKNVQQLMDKPPASQYFHKVRKAALNTKGVLGTEKVRIQLYGPDAHVDIDIEVDPKLQVEEAHKISQEVRLEIQKEWPKVRDVTVHIEPFYENDHN